MKVLKLFSPPTSLSGVEGSRGNYNLRSARPFNTRYALFREVGGRRTFIFKAVSLWLCLTSSLFATNIVQKQEEADFATSFIQNYDFSANARETREYHSYILGMARQSFLQLEQSLRDEGFSLAGRVVLCGYQEDAIASYYTFDAQQGVCDEVSQKTQQGWQFAQGNLFGFMTGFLLRDCAKFSSSTFHHIGLDRIGLFDDRAIVFQRHAFGQAYALAEYLRKKISLLLKNGQHKEVLTCLYQCWKQLYASGLKDGSNMLFGTQDILFSLHYMRYLLASQSPIIRLFTGPDITYPIEVLSHQKQSVTQGAQDFLQTFIDHLQPIDGKKTAYIFCSFVDGVGKSTLLGNLKNWHSYGQAFDQYKRVDNSSSQQAELFKWNEQVYLVDLPAQMSHYVPKPDGMVFVDYTTISTQQQMACYEARVYAQLHHHELEKQFEQMLKEYQAGALTNIGDETPAQLYAKNVCLLKTSADNCWIPFSCKDQWYLLHTKDASKLRVLVPFEAVHSVGLKVVEPEQMLFYKGLTVPLPYTDFLARLTTDLREQGVSNIVFVDFMNMYPRTSRETIRINFILQQLSQLFPDTFCKNTSLYKGFMYQQELYILLKKNYAGVLQALFAEVLVRWSLHKLHEQAKQAAKKLLCPATITLQLKQWLHDLDKEKKQSIEKIVRRKLRDEYEDAHKVYAYDRDLETLVMMDISTILTFSETLHTLFTQQLECPILNALWKPCHQERVIFKRSVYGPTELFFAHGEKAEVLYSFEQETRDPSKLKECFSLLRSQWYIMLANLLYAHPNGDKFFLKEPKFHVSPLFVVRDTKGIVYVARRKLPSSAVRVGKPFQTDMQNIKTSQGIYAYGCEIRDGQRLKLTSLIKVLKSELEKERMSPQAVPTSLVLEQAHALKLWHSIKQEALVAAKKHQSVAVAIPAVQVWARALVTLDMILKDLDTTIMVRRGNKEDFAAGLKLLEAVTLPYYFGITFSQPLFKEYQRIPPLLENFLMNDGK